MKRPMAKATADTSARGAYRDAGPFGYPWMHGCRWRHSKMLVPRAETSALTVKSAVWQLQGCMAA